MLYRAFAKEMNSYLIQNTTFQRVKDISLFETENFSVFSFTEDGVAAGLKKADRQPPVRQPKVNAKQKAQAARAEKKAAAKAKVAKDKKETGAEFVI